MKRNYNNQNNCEKKNKVEGLLYLEIQNSES